MNKLDCFSQFDKVHSWMSRTRDLVTNAGTYTYPALLQSLRKATRKSRGAEFALLLALYGFQREMEEYPTDTRIQ